MTRLINETPLHRRRGTGGSRVPSGPLPPGQGAVALLLPQVTPVSSGFPSHPVPFGPCGCLSGKWDSPHLVRCSPPPATHAHTHIHAHTHTDTHIFADPDTQPWAGRGAPGTVLRCLPCKGPDCWEQAASLQPGKLNPPLPPFGGWEGEEISRLCPRPWGGLPPSVPQPRWWGWGHEPCPALTLGPGSLSVAPCTPAAEGNRRPPSSEPSCPSQPLRSFRVPSPGPGTSCWQSGSRL